MRRKMNQRGGIITFGIAAVVVGVAIFVSKANQNILGWLRQVCLFFDSIAYAISTWGYSIFYEVSSSSLLSSLNLSAASQRLYTLLGIFMLFRLAFSFIKFIINPEGMEKGTSKLLSNLAVSLALIVSVPWIFNRAFALQTYIMDSNVIGNLILGINNSNENENTFNSSSYGQQIAFLTFSAFYHPDSSIPALSDCGNLLYYYSDNLKIDGSKLSIDEGQNGKPLTKEELKIANCVNALNGGDGFTATTSDTAEIGTLFYIASQRYSITILSNTAVWGATIGNQYVVEYTPLISLIAGFFLGFLFLNFSFDVAVRNVKLCFLQIIAPIPIILNIEPGDAKGDKKSLSWWTRECLKTYVDLFIRVATVYFGVFLINVLFGNGTSSVVGSTNTSNWFKIFMIIGILLFVKQIPELIGKAFGIEVKGQFSLNPLKRLRENKLTGGLIGAGLGLVSGRGIGGAYHGAVAGAGGKKFLENMKEQAGRKNAFKQEKANGSKPGGRMVARYNRLFGVNAGDQGRLNKERNRINKGVEDQENEIRKNDELMAPAKEEIKQREQFSAAVSEIQKLAIEQIIGGKAGRFSQVYSAYKAEVDRKNALYKAGLATLAEVTDAETDRDNFLNSIGRDGWIDEVINHKKSGSLYNKYQVYNGLVAATGGALGLSAATSAADLDKAATDQNDAITKLLIGNQKYEFDKSRAEAEKHRYEAQRAAMAEKEAKLKADQNAIK